MKWKWLVGKDSWASKRGEKNLLLRDPDGNISKKGRLYGEGIIFERPIICRVMGRRGCFGFTRQLILYPEKFGLNRIQVYGKDKFGKKVEGGCDISILQKALKEGKLKICRMNPNLDQQVFVLPEYFEGKKE